MARQHQNARQSAPVPEANNADTLRIAGARGLREQVAEGAIPGALYQALETRLQKIRWPGCGGAAECERRQSLHGLPVRSRPDGIASGSGASLAQARILADYLRISAGTAGDPPTG
ncbi:hypothetical protein ACVXG7_04505 [Enterobacter hormaechei]